MRIIPAQHKGGFWIRHDLAAGIQDGLPIGLGYLTVSFAFGIFTSEGGMSPLMAALLSLTNLTSAGQFAGASLIFAGAPWIELALTTLLINVRYLLMSLSLSQKIRPDLGIWPRLLIGYGVTDEIYAVAIMHTDELGLAYMSGLMSLPVVGWTAGTLLGSLAGYILPLTIRSALGIALYAMFVAIVMPSVRQSRPVLIVVLIAAGLSILGRYLPCLTVLPFGWRLIICTLIAACSGALLAPIQSAPTPLPSDKSDRTVSEDPSDSAGDKWDE